MPIELQKIIFTFIIIIIVVNNFKKKKNFKFKYIVFVNLKITKMTFMINLKNTENLDRNNSSVSEYFFLLKNNYFYW